MFIVKLGPKYVIDIHNWLCDKKDKKMKQTKAERITKESKYMVAQTVWYVFGTNKCIWPAYNWRGVWWFSGIVQKACNLNTDCDLNIVYPLTFLVYLVTQEILISIDCR